MSGIDFQALNQAALAQCPALLETLLPGGKIQGREYVCSSLEGGNGNSCSVNMETGKWSDFATGDSGKDIISLVAAIHQEGQVEAARRLADMTGFTLPETTSKGRQPQEEKPKVIQPIPEGVAIPEPDKLHHPGLGKPTAVYTYLDQQERFLGYTCRFAQKELDGKGKPKKQFSQFVYTSKGWRWQYFKSPFPFYNAQNLSKMPPDVPIIVLEGEAKADALQAAMGQFCAVLGIFGGSKQAGKADFSILQDRRVVFWPDADAPGAAAALAFSREARRVAASVFIVDPPRDVPEGWDAANAVNEGWDNDRLIGYITAHRMDLQEFECAAAARWGIGEQAKDTASGEKEEQDSPVDAILPKPPVVPLEAFPLPVAKLIQEAAAAFFTPYEIPTTAILSLLSALVGRSRAISLKKTWREHGNIWLALVGKSADGKSPVMRAMYAPLKRLEAEAQREYEQEYDAYEDNIAEYRSQKRKGDENSFIIAKPVPPKLKQALVDDITLECLANALRDNPKGLQWQRDELSGLLFDFDRYSRTGGGTKARLLSSYDCESWKTNRSGANGRNVYVPKACISIFGGIQPGMLGRVFEAGNHGSDIESGFLQRFIFIRSEQDKPDDWNENILSPESEELLEKITTSLWQWGIELDAHGKEIERIVPVSREAKEAYIGWFKEVSREAFLAENGALLKKLRGKAQRLCLLLHCLDAAITGTDGMTPITGDCMNRAILLGTWVKRHEEQCWQLFQEEKRPMQPEPLERAIMDVCLEHQEEIAANKDRISNAELCRLVSQKLNIPVSNDQIGRAAARLGLTAYKSGNERGRIVRQEKLNLFLEISVPSVPSVPTPHEYTKSGENTLKNQVSQRVPSVPTQSEACPKWDTWDANNASVLYPETLDTSEKGTHRTLGTLGNDSKSKNGNEQTNVSYVTNNTTLEAENGHSSGKPTFPTFPTFPNDNKSKNGDAENGLPCNLPPDAAEWEF